MYSILLAAVVEGAEEIKNTGILEHINWQLVTIVVSVLTFIGTLIKIQINTNKKIFIEIANIKKDVGMNTERIEEHNIHCNKDFIEMLALMNKQFDKNDDQHNKIEVKIDKITEYLLGKNK